MRSPDPDRQVELVELLAALDVAESLSLDDPIALYLREVASVEPLTLSIERELLAAVRRGDEAARLKLTELNLWEVVRIARQFLGRGLAFLDLVQEGNLGLMRAIAEVPFKQRSFREQLDARIREAIEHALG